MTTGAQKASEHLSSQPGVLPAFIQPALFGLMVLALAACNSGDGDADSYTVNPEGGDNGSVTPAAQTVEDGESASFTVTPDSGYMIDLVAGCDGVLDGDTYTIDAIASDCTVTVNFKLIPPDSPTLSLTPTAIKSFNFSWTDVSGESEYRLLENPDGESGYTPVATLPADTTEHEFEVFLPGRINASYILQACNSGGCSDSSAVHVDGTLAETVGYVKASNPGLGHQFGNSVALSDDGNTLAVGAPFENSDATGIGGHQDNSDAPDSGAVYLFSRNNGGWSREAYVKASNTEAGAQFGWSVALSGDGNTLAVGARHEDNNVTGIGRARSSTDAEKSGAVYVFSHTGGSWSQQAYVKASNTDAGDWFGYSLALSYDGNTLAVGAHREASNATGIDGDQSNNTDDDSGAVYVFTRVSSFWSQQAYVKASNTDADDWFGYSVALSGAGKTMAVGAILEDSNANGIGGNQDNNEEPGSGAVYVFTYSSETWSQQAYIKASNTEAGDEFGWSVALSNDGNTLAAGAAREDSNAIGIDGNQTNNEADTSGAVYVFTRSHNDWSQQAYVKASNTGEGHGFGYSVTLSNDGNTLAVGALQEDSYAIGIDGNQTNNKAVSSGAVYLFARAGGVWSQQAYIKSANTNASDQFSRSVALSGKGNTLAVGANQEDSNAIGIGGNLNDNSVSRSGAAYLY